MHLPLLARRALEVVVVLLALGLGALSLRSPTPPSASGAAAASGPLVVVISGGALSATTVQQAAASIRWTGRAIEHAGAGIGKAPAGEQPLAVAVRTDKVDRGARMLLVQGGESLIGTDQAAFQVAAYHLIDYLAAYKPPGATLVIAGPIPGAAGASSTMVAADKIMRMAARQRGVRYIDAIELGWTSDRDLSKLLGEQILVASKPRALPTLVPAGASPSPSSPSPSPSSSASLARATESPSPSLSARAAGSPSPSGRPSP